MNSVFTAAASPYPWSGIVVAVAAMVAVGLVMYIVSAVRRRRR